MSGYRRGALRCPACGEVMRAQAEGGAHVDVCPRCQGVWVDWEDGDVETVVRGMGWGRAAAPATGGDGACPICATVLHEERSLAAPFLRCGTCVGAFVPRDSFEHLAQGHDQDASDASLLTRVLDAVARLLTPGG